MPPKNERTNGRKKKQEQRKHSTKDRTLSRTEQQKEERAEGQSVGTSRRHLGTLFLSYPGIFFRPLQDLRIPRVDKRRHSTLPRVTPLDGLEDNPLRKGQSADLYNLKGAFRTGAFGKQRASLLGARSLEGMIPLEEFIEMCLTAFQRSPTGIVQRASATVCNVPSQ